jgi:DNA invertase Pin-like site-specific DNA recombinase
MGSPGAKTAAGTAVLVYLVLSGRLCGDGAGAVGGRGAMEDEMISSAVSAAAAARKRRGKEEARARRRARRAKRGPPERAPDGWGEAAVEAARTMRFAYGETLGKWSLGELAFGINYYMRQQVRAPCS